jgi:hypothetical protein
MHDAIPQVVSDPTKLVQAVALVPSHVMAVQGSDGSDWGQPASPAGVPVIVTHVPVMLAVLHAWHRPVHAVVQQTPSAQVAPAGQVADVVHMAPMPTITTVTVTVAVPFAPRESVAVTRSEPAMAPAV